MTDTGATGPKPRRAATVFIFITIVLDVLALGMVIPVMPQLITRIGNLDEKQTLVWLAIFGTTWAIMQLLASPVQGALSDRYGRRPVILASNFGMGANYLFMALAPNMLWLFVGRLISGVCSGSIPAAMAYLADVNPPEKRAASFGLMGGALSLGFAIGPALGGLLGGLDPRAPFWAAAGLSLLNFLYGAFVLPESLPRERRAPLQLRHMNPIGAIRALLLTYPAIGGMLAVSALLTLAQMGPFNVFVVYTQHRYHWGPPQVGLFMTGSGLTSMLVQTLLVQPAVRRLGERKALLIGGTLQISAFALLALAATGPAFWLAIPLMALAAIGGPAWSSVLSRTVGPSEQGLLAGASSSLNSLTSIVSPTLYTMTFAAAVSQGSPAILGAPFWLAAVIMLAAISLAAWVTRARPAIAV